MLTKSGSYIGIHDDHTVGRLEVWFHEHVSTTLDYITLHFTPLHYNYNYTTTLHYTPLHYITLHSTTLHYITQHCTTLPSTTLHYITLHYTQLHYNYTYNYAALH